MQHKVVSPSEWLAARKALLLKEKEFTKARDELSRLRRELPWTKVEKSYVFEGASGRQSLAELFDDRTGRPAARTAHTGPITSIRSSSTSIIAT
jgi:predicted dithiol-disulfide oxidoreductase (DUF899 family)